LCRGARDIGPGSNSVLVIQVGALPRGWQRGREERYTDARSLIRLAQAPSAQNNTELA
jgi:hypothetical protein